MTNKSTERNAPRVEVVTLNYILITINLCSFIPCNSWQSGQGKSLEYGDTRLLGGEIELRGSGAMRCRDSFLSISDLEFKCPKRIRITRI